MHIHDRLAELYLLYTSGYLSTPFAIILTTIERIKLGKTKQVEEIRSREDREGEREREQRESMGDIIYPSLQTSPKQAPAPPSRF